MKKWALTMGLMLGAACNDDAANGDGGGGSGAGGGATGGAGGSEDYSALYACEEVEFAEAKPLSGPGYDPMTGFSGTPQSSYVVHATQIYLRPEQYNAFYKAAGEVVAQLAGTEGLVAFTIGDDDACGVARTMGVWTSEEAMYAFVGSGAHAKAMAQTAALTFTGRTTHWEATPEEVEALTWDVARAKLADVEPLGY